MRELSGAIFIVHVLTTVHLEFNADYFAAAAGQCGRFQPVCSTM